MRNLIRSLIQQKYVIHDVGYGRIYTALTRYLCWYS